MSGTLFIVATPIGNLEDITPRALRILREADLIAAEDTRVTRELLAHFEIMTPLTSYHQHSGGRKAEALLRQLAEGSRIALVSDAGMPGIADPGHELIRLAIDSGVPVVPVPGATALVAALAGCGLSTIRFSFEGFPPRDPAERAALFESRREMPHTLVFYESPPPPADHAARPARGARQPARRRRPRADQAGRGVRPRLTGRSHRLVPGPRAGRAVCCAGGGGFRGGKAVAALRLLYSCGARMGRLGHEVP